jgi:hypothetical protein
MKAIFLIALLLIASTSASSRPEASSEAPSLELITTITKQRYCDSGYSDMALMWISLQLTFTNKADQPLILYKGSNLPHYVLVSLNELNASNKQYEVNQHVGWVTTGEPKLAEGSKPGREFVVLRPSGSYHTEAEVSLSIALGPDSKFLKAGNYVLQIIVDKWPTDEIQFNRLKQKWRRTGELWGRAIKSEPMPFEVKRSPVIEECK